MQKKVIFGLVIALLLNYAPLAYSEVQVGVKAGDWIKCDITTPGTGTVPQWAKIEFLSVSGTSVTAWVTLHMSDETEHRETIIFDVATGSGNSSVPGLVIPANSKTGDTIHINENISITIAGETTRSYAGASRTVVNASFSQLNQQFTFYWDKQTGVIVELSFSGEMTLTATLTSTNIWQAGGFGFNPIPVELDPMILCAIIMGVIDIAIVITFSIILKKKLS